MYDVLRDPSSVSSGFNHLRTEAVFWFRCPCFSTYPLLFWALDGIWPICGESAHLAGGKVAADIGSSVARAFQHEMEAIRDAYSSSDSSDEGEMVKKGETSQTSAPLHEPPRSMNALPRKRSLKPESDKGSKKKSRSSPMTNLPPPPPHFYAERASEFETTEIQHKARSKPALALKNVMCPPRQVRTKQSNISTEDLVSYGCTSKTNQKR